MHEWKQIVQNYESEVRARRHLANPNGHEDSWDSGTDSTGKIFNKEACVRYLLPAKVEKRTEIAASSRANNSERDKQIVRERILNKALNAFDRLVLSWDPRDSSDTVLCEQAPLIDMENI